METIFYDGHCGLCHRFVRFTLRRDRRERFLFAPLYGEHFRAHVPEDRRAGLPDSVVVQTEGGSLLVKSAAVMHVLMQIGGGSRLIARVCRIVPAPIADFFYDRVAQVRKTLFATPTDVCPILPPELRPRFRP